MDRSAPRAAVDETQVFGVGDVVVDPVAQGQLAGEDRREDALDPRLAQALNQGIQVGVSAGDEDLLRLVDVGRLDRGKAFGRLA